MKRTSEQSPKRATARSLVPDFFNAIIGFFAFFGFFAIFGFTGFGGFNRSGFYQYYYWY
jgi:hypothetical protein